MLKGRVRFTNDLPFRLEGVATLGKLQRHIAPNKQCQVTIEFMRYVFDSARAVVQISQMLLHYLMYHSPV